MFVIQHMQKFVMYRNNKALYVHVCSINWEKHCMFENLLILWLTLI